TRERCQAVARHPRTGERVWFNQANLFHLSALDDDMQDALAQIRGVLERQRIVFPWRTGDVLMLDNMLSA
ncbi:TauD/TfdA family dioxygenase, partial [Salmonella enterica]|uniref:TauD/TfdA family dioxygenase n=1 Tax=Salmonella enterica TaxID=28901 RepID=UPI00329781D4